MKNLIMRFIKRGVGLNTICVLMGSPRKNGNTAALLRPMVETFKQHSADAETIWLYDKKIEGCIACLSCQKDHTRFGCSHDDDMQEVFDAVLKSDVLLLATPIYSWYCTAPMKAALDRLVYGMNKYYGEVEGPSLWEGKKVAILGDRDGIPGPAIEECVKSAGAEVVFSVTECFV